jgi:hypothetical protein
MSRKCFFRGRNNFFLYGVVVRNPCAFSVEEDTLVLIDRRAKSLGMNRSQYILQCVRRDLANQSAPLSVVAEMPAPVLEPRINAVTYRKKRPGKGRKS